MLTNPEDTGIYNPNIREFVDLVHAAGGLCAYDQANTNGILGVARAKEAVLTCAISTCTRLSVRLTVFWTGLWRGWCA